MTENGTRKNNGNGETDNKTGGLSGNQENTQPEYVIEYIEGDITKVTVDAIVTPNVPSLRPFLSGVAGAIHCAGGELAFEEAKKIADSHKVTASDPRFPIPFHAAVITGGGNLKHTQHVIHSIALDHINGSFECNPQTVYDSAKNVLELAHMHNLKSVAFPALGSGLYGLSLTDALGSIDRAAVDFFKRRPDSLLKTVKLVFVNPSHQEPSFWQTFAYDRAVGLERRRGQQK